jgi:phosphoserine phosphatase
MTCSAIISDWNGTLYRNADEEAFLRTLGMELAKRCVPGHPVRLIRLINAKKKLEGLILKNIESDCDYVVDIYRVYNKEVIRGTPVSLIHRLVESYSGLPKVQNKIIHDMLRPISAMHQQGVVTGILSAGYKYGIQMTLKAACYDHCFDFCEANSLDENDGRAIGFTLDIYKNKTQKLIDLLDSKNIEAKKLVYIGDSSDDAGCFEIAGFPVVSFLTPDKLKEEFAKKYSTFIPQNEKDLEKYLKSL